MVLSGFSGAGKGTLVKKLLSAHDNYSLSVSATTRAPREGETPLEVLEEIALRRGYRVRGGDPDYERTAATVVDDFRSGKLGRLSLEVPEE